MQISPHFTLEELTVTKWPYANVPQPPQIESLTALAVNVLEPIRAQFGPVIINSAFRSEQVNRASGGTPTSQHLFGEAADFYCPNVNKADIWRWIVANGKLLQFDQVIAEHLKPDDIGAGWIHVSYKRGRSRKSAISCVGKNDYVPGLQYERGF